MLHISKYRKNSEKWHFFVPPSDPQILERWTRRVARADKLLGKTCNVCNIHFHPPPVVKTYKHIVDGEVVAIKRGAWTLKSDTVPKRFPNLPSYLFTSRVNGRFMAYDRYSSSRVVRCSLRGWWRAQLIECGIPFDTADAARGPGPIVIISINLIVELFSSAMAIKTRPVSHWWSGMLIVTIRVRIWNYFSWQTGQTVVFCQQ